MTATVWSQGDATSILALGGLGPAAGAPIWLSLVQFVLAVGAYVWVALALTAVFRKAGVAPWKAWVPVVNAWSLFVLAGMRGWWAVVIAGATVVVGIATSVIMFGALAGANQAAFAGDAAGAAAAVLGGTLISGALFAAVGIFALVLQIKMLLRVNRGFGFGVGFVVLGALLFPVWASIVGWGSARWLGLDASVDDGPSLTPPPPAPAASPFTLGAASAPPAAAPAPAGAFAPPAPTPAASPFASTPPLPPVPHEPAAPAYTAPEQQPVAPAAAPASGLVSHTPWAPPAPPTPDPVSVPAAAPAVAPTAAPAAAPTPAPRAAAPAAAAGHADDLDERTVLAVRKQAGWTLSLPDGSSVSVTGDAVVLGRNPSAPADAPHAQLVPVADATRTVSKTHALLRRIDQGWVITDLASTNGVFLVDGENEVEVSGSAAVSRDFMLGDAALTLNEA